MALTVDAVLPQIRTVDLTIKITPAPLAVQKVSGGTDYKLVVKETSAYVEGSETYTNIFTLFMM